MKKSRKLIAVLLSLLMAASCFGLCFTAAAEYEVDDVLDGMASPAEGGYVIVTYVGEDHGESGVDIIIKAVANDGYRFVGWYDGEDELSSEEEEISTRTGYFGHDIAYAKFELIPAGSDEGDIHWDYDEDTKTLTISGTGAMPDYEYDDPAWYSYDPQGEGTAIYHYEIENVIIEDGVTSIGEYAFWDCFTLKSVTIPASVTSIDEGAFYNCTALQTVNYAGSEEDWNNIDMGDYAFFMWSDEADDAIPLEDYTVSYNYGAEPDEPTPTDSDKPAATGAACPVCGAVEHEIEWIGILHQVFFAVKYLFNNVLYPIFKAIKK